MEILARGVGRRKEAVAQVQIVKGTGNFLINNIPAQQYLHNNTYSMLSLKAPLNILNSSTVVAADNENVNITTEQNVNSLNENAPFSSQREGGNQTNNAPVTISTDVLTNLSYPMGGQQFDTIVKVKGGGLIGQAEAIKLGLARALCSLTTNETGVSEEEIRKQLKDKGYLTQDSRVKERRKYGLKKARKATQYNKR